MPGAHASSAFLERGLRVLNLGRPPPLSLGPPQGETANDWRVFTDNLIPRDMSFFAKYQSEFMQAYEMSRTESGASLGERRGGSALVGGEADQGTRTLPQRSKA